MDCLFCKITLKEIFSEIVYEDKFTLAFLDIHPCTPGHAIIVPKAHAENIITIEDKYVGPLFLAVKKVTKKIETTLQPQGFTIGINHGILAGQAIDHLHIHVIPRYRDDGGGSLHSIVHIASDTSLAELAKRIKG
ncbi:MAG TPA: HIT family protein [Candidatus Paceibacterota bacterium]